MIDCAKFAQEWKEDMRRRITSALPALVIVQVGEDAASNAYVKGKIADCAELGVWCSHIHLQEDIDYTTAAEMIQALNADKKVGGIIVQLPLPKRLTSLPSLIAPEKDIDGLVYGSHFTPCTAKAVMKLIDWLNYDLTGKTVVIIGRSRLVGRPLIDLMLARNATVVSCNSHTEALVRLVRMGDVVVSATGVKGLVDADMVSSDALVIDVGISRGKDGKLYGDCDRGLYKCVEKITPVPKGVGLLTRCALIDNFLDGVGR